MKRAPARLLDSASLSPLERRVLEAARAARFDFDLVAGVERLREAIHAGGPALGSAAAHSIPAATSLKLACLLASAAGLGAAYYGFSDGSSESASERSRA